MPTPPRDKNSEEQSSPYGPAPVPSREPEPVPPVTHGDTPVPPIEAPPEVASSPPPPPPSYVPPPGNVIPVPPPYGSGSPAPQPYQSGPGAPQPYPYGPPAAPKPPRTLSMLSMIFGIVSVPLSCCWGFGFFFAVAAIILGHLGRKKETAKGMALAGLIIGYIVAAFSAVLLVLFIGLGVIDTLTR